jgi:hypothetical protein
VSLSARAPCRQDLQSCDHDGRRSELRSRSSATKNRQFIGQWSHESTSMRLRALSRALIVEDAGRRFGYAIL